MPHEDKPAGHQPQTGHLEKEEIRLWRLALWFLVLLAIGFAALAWERLQNLPYHLGLVALGLVAVAVLFAVYVYGRRRQVSELRNLLDGLEKRSGAAPSKEQLDQLSQVLARSQRSFKELIDAFDEVAFAASLDGTLRTVNRRVTQLLGLSYSEIVGHKADEFILEPALGDPGSGLARFLERRRWSGVVQVQLKNNSRVLYFECVLNAIVNDDQVVGASALARDVTEEREKERRFTELFETLQEGVYFSTPEGNLLEANAALVQMLGYSGRDELLALTATALNSDPNEAPVLGRSAGDRGGERTREISLRRKDGTVGIFQDTSRAVRDTAGKIIRYQGTLVDITERRKMERTLRRQEEFQRYLLESFPDLILVIDLNETYSFVSSRIRDLLGYHPEDFLGKKLEDLQDHSPELVALYRDVSTGRKKFGFSEYGARHRDGSWRTMRATASPLFDADNKVNGVIVSVRDITLEKKLEQQIIQSERLAAMGQMIGGFAHELNNPLTSIMGLAELLQENESSEPLRKQLAMLQQQARRAADVVQNLMYFSRPPSPGKGTVNLGELVQRTLHLHAYSLRKKAMRDVRDRGTLRVRLEKGTNSVSAIFQDDGPGIPVKILPNIFDPFYTTKRPGRGTGLGLSICKAILREHLGNIEASSGPGGGALFTVTLPVPSSK